MALAGSSLSGMARNLSATRLGIFTPDELAAHATYGSLTAVNAGQISPWNQDFIQSYQGLTAAQETIVAALESAEDVTS